MKKNLKVVVRKAKKVSAEEASKLGRATMGKSRSTPRKRASVEAQNRVEAKVQCPYCMELVECDLDSDIYRWFQCSHCHQYFKK